MKIATLVATVFFAGVSHAGDDDPLTKLVNSLEDRCGEWRAVQLRIHERTKQLQRTIAAHSDQKPRRADRRLAAELAADQAHLAAKVDKVCRMLQKENSLIFPEVFEVVRDDMKKVHQRLIAVDVSSANQEMQEDISATLKEMIAALQPR